MSGPKSISAHPLNCEKLLGSNNVPQIVSVGLDSPSSNNDFTLKQYLVSKKKLKGAKINQIFVPGAFEISGTIRQVLKQRHKPDAIVALGAIIQGETPLAGKFC